MCPRNVSCGVELLACSMCLVNQIEGCLFPRVCVCFFFVCVCVCVYVCVCVCLCACVGDGLIFVFVFFYSYANTTGQRGGYFETYLPRRSPTCTSCSLHTPT